LETLENIITILVCFQSLTAKNCSHLVCYGEALARKLQAISDPYYCTACLHPTLSACLSWQTIHSSYRLRLQRSEPHRLPACLYFSSRGYYSVCQFVFYELLCKLHGMLWNK